MVWMYAFQRPLSCLIRWRDFDHSNGGVGSSRSRLDLWLKIVCRIPSLTCFFTSFWLCLWADDPEPSAQNIFLSTLSISFQILYSSTPFPPTVFQRWWSYIVFSRLVIIWEIPQLWYFLNLYTVTPKPWVPQYISVLYVWSDHRGKQPRQGGCIQTCERGSYQPRKNKKTRS